MYQISKKWNHLKREAIMILLHNGYKHEIRFHFPANGKHSQAPGWFTLQTVSILVIG